MEESDLVVDITELENVDPLGDLGEVAVCCKLGGGGL